MKKYFDSIIGNNAIKERLSLDIESKKVSHAYIFEGEDGCGRHTLALQLAAAISCQSLPICCIVPADRHGLRPHDDSKICCLVPALRSFLQFS